MSDRASAASRAVAVPSGRMSRLARLGSMGAGVAGSMAANGIVQIGRGQRPSTRGLLLTPANARRVTEQLAQMRGAAMKLGQILSMDTGDVLPPELAQILSSLRADAHFMPPAQLKKVLSQAWPADWLRSFARFDVRPMAAASIGQVHRAVLRDGPQMAIKVQYPGVADSIDSDVANVGALIRMTGLLPKGFELAPYLEQARAQLHDETDYELEARHLNRFRGLLADDDRFALPTVLEAWTTRHVLAMTFVEGEPIEEAARASQAQRDAAMANLVDLVLSELFEFRLMQTDPNFANYLYQPQGGRIVLLDFGATRAIDPDITALYRRLLRTGLEDDTEGQIAAAEALGILSPEVPDRHRERIVGMMGMVFAALRRPEPFDFAATDLPRRMQAEGLALAEAGFVPPPVPIDVLYLQRKFAGMFLLGARLGARVTLTERLWGHV